MTSDSVSTGNGMVIESYCSAYHVHHHCTMPATNAFTANTANELLNCPGSHATKMASACVTS